MEWAAQIIGINKYGKHSTLESLTAAAQDAESIAQLLKQYSYRQVPTQYLAKTLNQKRESTFYPQGAVSVEELRAAIANLFNPPEPNPTPDTAIFFFSGHGWRKSVNGKEEVFLATSDVYPKEEIYGIPLSWLGEQLQTSQAKRVIVWLDCCYSGELLNYSPTNKDYCLITATLSYEVGYEIPREHGLLTQALLAGLNPENDPDGIINSHKLADFIKNQMAQTAQRPLIKNSQRAILLTSKSRQRNFQDICPYRSLSYFTESPQDAEVFYGRSALTQDLITQVEKAQEENKSRLIAVLGASGSGKSSLLRAGLLYQLKLGQKIPGSDRWIYITPFSPKETPVQSLQQAVFDSFSDLVFEQQTTEHITHVIGEKLQPLNTPVILIIDQFEECFTMCDDSQRKEFFDCLITLMGLTDKLYVFLGMRSDFRGRWREYPEFAEKIHKPYINVEHLKPREIEEAITKPADWVGLYIQPELKRQLINDVGDYPGSLPLLQYTLTELWRESRKQGDDCLRFETYQSLGGVEGTLQKSADAVYETLSPAEQTVARRIFLELTQIGETTDVRRRVRLGELVNSRHSLELLQQVSEKLADKDARLITKTDEPNSHDVILDVVHEALIRHWQKLRDWKEEYKLGMEIERQIEAEAAEWKRNDQREGFLRKDDRLILAEEYLKKFGDWQMLNAVAEEYIEVSQKLRHRLEQEKEEGRKKEIKRARRIAFGAISAGLIMAGLAIFATIKGREAQIGQIKALTQSSESKFTLNRYSFDALLDALRAGKRLQELPWGNIEYQLQADVIKVLNQAVFWSKEQNRLEEHSSWVNSLSFSSDGQKIASASGDGTIKIWQRNGKVINSLKGHKRGVTSVSFSPNGQILVSGSLDETVRLWHQDGTLLKQFSGVGKVRAVDFSHDGQTFAAAGENNTVKLWKLNGQLDATLIGHTKRVNSINFSPDGEIIASASDDGTVKLWRRDGRLVKELKGHQREVISLRFSPNSQVLASGSLDNTIKLWRRDGTLIKTLKGHSDGIRTVSFSPNGKMLASGGRDNTVKLWQPEDGTLLTTLTGHSNVVNNVSFSPDGQILVTASNDASIKLWQLKNPMLTILTDNTNNEINSISFNPNGQLIAAASMNNTLQWWRHDGTLVNSLIGHNKRINNISFSPNGKLLASASFDGTVKLWDINGNLNLTLKDDTKFTDVTFSGDGQKIATSDFDGTVKIWREDGTLIQSLKGHDGIAYSVRFSPDNQLLASVGGDGKLRLWKADGTPIVIRQESQEREPSLYQVRFSPNGQKIAAASTDGTIKLWTVDGTLVRILGRKGTPMTSVSFSPDGQIIASANETGTIFLWQLDGKLITKLTGHSKVVLSLSFSPDGKTLASGSDDASIILWNLNHLNLNHWLKLGCGWVQDYLKNNSNINTDEPHLCTGSSIGL